MFLSDDTSTDENPTFLIEGDEIIPYRTDGETFIDVKMKSSDGIYRIYIGLDDNGYWSVTNNGGIGGSDRLIDCFDGLIFAG